jgi:hypothetical protein
MSELSVKTVQNGFIVTDVDLGEEYIFTKEFQVIRFLKERFKAVNGAAND